MQWTKFMAWGSLFFKFDGRINRAKYLLTIVALFAICTPLFVLNNFSQRQIVQATSIIIYAIVLISFLAVSIKRLHDRNRPGWYLILFYIVPSVLFFVGILVINYFEDWALIGSLLGLLAVAMGVWAFIELCCLRGTDGINRYGRDQGAPPTQPTRMLL